MVGRSATELAEIIKPLGERRFNIIEIPYFGFANFGKFLYVIGKFGLVNIDRFIGSERRRDAYLERFVFKLFMPA